MPRPIAPNSHSTHSTQRPFNPGPLGSLQVPLITLTEMLKKRFKHDMLGNLAFWFAFCILGQPMSLLMYAYDYSVTHQGGQLGAGDMLAAEAAAQLVG